MPVPVTGTASDDPGNAEDERFMLGRGGSEGFDCVPDAEFLDVPSSCDSKAGAIMWLTTPGADSVRWGDCVGVNLPS